MTAAAIVALSTYAGHARADDAPIASARQAAPTSLADDELGRQRGGFVWAGMTINLGAEIRSYVDGKLIVQTNIVWGDTGATIQRTVFAGGTDAVATSGRDNLLALGALHVGAGDVGIVLANQGRTAFVQAANGSLRSIVLNTANATNLRQQIDVTIDIANFAPVRRAAVAASVGMSLVSLGGR